MTDLIPAAPRRAAFIFVFLTVLLDMLALGIIVPVLPKLVVDFLGGDTARGAEMFGLFGTVWALMQFVFSPLLGALSDRFGRRPLILISNFGLGLDYILMALAPNLWWLFVGRVISGITRRQHLDRLCLHRRRDAAGSAPRASACWASPSAPASCSGRRSAGSPARSIRGCRSGSRRA